MSGGWTKEMFMKKQIYKTGTVLTVMMLFTACAAVDSTELKSTKAADLRLNVIATEYKDANSTAVRAKMETPSSHIAVELDEGQKLQASIAVADELHEWIQLSNSDFIDFGKDLEGNVPKRGAGEDYYVSYIDADGIETIASFANGSVSELTKPAENAQVDAVASMQWNPAEVSGGDLIAIANWSSGGASGFMQRRIDNNGSYAFDVSDAKGSGEIQLKSSTAYSQAPGFSSASILMLNIARKAVSFSAPNQNLNRSVGSLEIQEENEDLENFDAEAFIQDHLNECLHYCEDGEISKFFVHEEEYSCCLEK